MAEHGLLREPERGEPHGSPTRDGGADAKGSDCSWATVAGIIVAVLAAIPVTALKGEFGEENVIGALVVSVGLLGAGMSWYRSRRPGAPSEGGDDGEILVRFVLGYLPVSAVLLALVSDEWHEGALAALTSGFLFLQWAWFAPISGRSGADPYEVMWGRFPPAMRRCLDRVLIDVDEEETEYLSFPGFTEEVRRDFTSLWERIKAYDPSSSGS